jgi:PKHD-type hydroxylase
MARLQPLDMPTARALVAGSDADLPAAVDAHGVFTAEECARIIGLQRTLGTDVARIAGRDAARGDRTVDPAIRRTDRTHILPGKAQQWIHDRLTQLVERENAAHWRFRLTHLEPPQLLRYPTGGHYAWHTDLGATGLMALRKLSLTVQLSDGETYEGGELEVQVGGRTVSPPRPLGSAILFPAWQPHRVTPVTSGTRHALVCWIIGKRSLR